MEAADAELRARIAARLEASTDAELIAVATRWREISGEWSSELFGDFARRELDFYEHYAGYSDPYHLFELAMDRGGRLDREARDRLLDYAMKVTGVYELVQFGIVPALVRYLTHGRTPEPAGERAVPAANRPRATLTV